MEKTVLEEPRKICGWLAVLEGPYRGEAYRIYSGKNIVGNDFKNSIVIKGLESQHFSLRCKDGEIHITDFDTELGLYIKGERIWHAKLKDGERIRAGEHLFAVKLI